MSQIQNDLLPVTTVPDAGAPPRPATSLSVEGEATSVCIVGYYGSNSTGDHAILKTFIQEMLPGPKSNLSVICQGAGRAYEKFARPNISVIEHFRVFGRGGIKNILKGRIFRQAKAISESDLLVIGGGSLLHDRFGLRTLLMTLDEIWWAKLRHRPVAIFSMGVGPLVRRSARWLVAKTVSHCDVVTVRDTGSKQLLVEIGVPAEKVNVLADPALLLAPVAVTDEQAPWLRSTADGQARKLVGVFVVDSLEFLAPDEKARLIENIAAALDELHTRFGFEFVFLPFSVMMGDDDRIMAFDVISKMKNDKSAHLVERAFEPEEMLWIERNFFLNITIRFHALIFSLSSAVPVVAIEYDPKVGHAMREFGLGEYVLPIDAEVSGKLIAAVSLVCANREGYIERIKARLPSRRRAAEETFSILRDLLGKSAAARTAAQRTVRREN